MTRVPNGIFLLVLAATLCLPLPAVADLVCPDCEAAAAALDVGQVVHLAFQTVLRKGISVMLLGAAAIVSVPWLLAGCAIAAFYLPRWLKRSS